LAVMSLASSGARSAVRARPLVPPPPRRRSHGEQPVTARAMVSGPGMTRAPSSTAMGLKCGHSMPGWSTASVVR
jgi:hypothetical protein